MVGMDIKLPVKRKVLPSHPVVSKPLIHMNILSINFHFPNIGCNGSSFEKIGGMDNSFLALGRRLQFKYFLHRENRHFLSELRVRPKIQGLRAAWHLFTVYVHLWVENVSDGWSYSLGPYVWNCCSKPHSNWGLPQIVFSGLGPDLVILYISYTWCIMGGRNKHVSGRKFSGNQKLLLLVSYGASFSHFMTFKPRSQTLFKYMCTSGFTFLYEVRGILS